MKAITPSSPPTLQRDMAELLSVFTHDAANPLINLDSLVLYLQRQSEDLKAAIASSHSSNIEHLLDQAIPKTIDMMLTSSQQMKNMNTALNQLYHCHCDELEDETCDLNPLVALMIDRLKAPENITIHVADLPSIEADPDAIQIIVKALISNAIISCAVDKAATIHITCDHNDEGFLFRIQDTGCGLIEEEISKIFTPFYRGMKSSGDSLGIGLSMARVLLERYHSRIDCTSIINMGSRFSFSWSHSPY